MKKRYIFPVAIVVLVLATVLFSQQGSSEITDIIVDVKQGKFVVDVTTTGELNALKSVRIMGPAGARRFRISQIKIESMVDEGTVVKKGEKVASLDRSELFGRLADAESSLDAAKSVYEQTRLDTAINLRTERDNIINLQYVLEEKQLILEQSQFEPPATIKQNEIAVEKAKRELKQSLENYQLKKQQAAAKMQEVAADLRDEQGDYNEMSDVLNEFTILAPQDGMVIYEKSWDGSRITEGSQINAWNPVVATLPDLSSMISVTYVNEVDIRKVKVGQNVNIGLDAYPEKKLSGKIIRVANVGQQNPNSDAKVFEVTIQINEKDPTLRPAMTTSNNIIVQKFDSVLFVPLEAVHSHQDSIQYVILGNGSKKEVELGVANANEVIIKQGISATDRVYLSSPDGINEVSIDLLDSMNGKRNLDKKEEEPALADSQEMPRRKSDRGVKEVSATTKPASQQ